MLTAYEMPQPCWLLLEEGWTLQPNHGAPALFQADVDTIEDLSPDELRCSDCGTRIGFGEETREDTYGREIESIGWVDVFLVHDSETGLVRPMCQDCAPEDAEVAS